MIVSVMSAKHRINISTPPLTSFIMIRISNVLCFAQLTELRRTVKLHICCWDIFHWLHGVKLENFCELFIGKNVATSYFKIWLLPGRLEEISYRPPKFLCRNLRKRININHLHIDVVLLLRQFFKLWNGNLHILSENFGKFRLSFQESV
jgi:hypothetical protein